MPEGDSNRRERKLVEIGNCPLCGGFIMCPADHDSDCERYGETGSAGSQTPSSE